MYLPDPQRDRLYCAQSLTIAGDADFKLTLDQAQATVDEVAAGLAVPPITLNARARDRVAGESRAEADPQHRVIYLDEAPAASSLPLLLIHEIAHVIKPTDEPHGAQFARLFLDLVDRYPRTSLSISEELRMGFRLYGVLVEESASEWSRPVSSLDLGRMRRVERSDDDEIRLDVMLRRHFAAAHDLLVKCQRLEIAT